ncbi:MAG: transposase [Segniliparus sp.]|uniref:transposase n=1 Tax=Segniliparus sp. TaxID=2804064 RepID=UPI003F4047C7
MGRRGYPPEFRHNVLEQVKTGRKVSDVAREAGISDQTIYSWLRQERVANRLASSLTDEERQELALAKWRIAQLEAELEAQRLAVAQRSEAMRPKAFVSRVWKPLESGLADRHSMRSAGGAAR